MEKKSGNQQQLCLLKAIKLNPLCTYTRTGEEPCANAHLDITFKSSAQPQSAATGRMRRSQGSAASRPREDVAPSDYCKNITQTCVECTSLLCQVSGHQAVSKGRQTGRSRVALRWRAKTLCTNRECRLASSLLKGNLPAVVIKMHLSFGRSRISRHINIFTGECLQILISNLYYKAPPTSTGECQLRQPIRSLCVISNICSCEHGLNMLRVGVLFFKLFEGDTETKKTLESSTETLFGYFQYFHRAGYEHHGGKIIIIQQHVQDIISLHVYYLIWCILFSCVANAACGSCLLPVAAGTSAGCDGSLAQEDDQKRGGQSSIRWKAGGEGAGGRLDRAGKPTTNQRLRPSCKIPHGQLSLCELFIGKREITA